MNSLYKLIEELCATKNVNITQMCVEAGITRATLTELKKGRTITLSVKTAQKIASYFGVTVGYLLGTEEEIKKDSAKNEVSDDDIKFALFGGDNSIPDEAYEDVKKYAAFLKEKYNAKL